MTKTLSIRNRALVASLLGTFCFSDVAYAQSQYMCHRPATPAQITKVRHPQGNWGPQHNTNNWYYDAVQRGDIYRLRNTRRTATVGTACRRGGPGAFDHGELIEDYEGLQDWCVRRVAATPEQVASFACPSGYSLTGSSSRPGATQSGRNDRSQQERPGATRRSD